MEASIDMSTLYVQYYKELFYIGYKMTNDTHLAEDIVHDTFIKAIKKVDTMEDERKVGAWLKAIARRTAIDRLRREKKRKVIPVEQETLDALGKDKQNVEQEVEAVFLMDQINRSFQKLSRDQQHVFILKWRDGLKEEEIASALKLKPCTVKTRSYRARNKLRNLCAEQVPV